MKGEGGGGSYIWKSLESDAQIASSSIHDILAAARTVNATELYIPRLTLTSIDSEGTTNCQYVDKNGIVKAYSTSYTSISTIGTRVTLRDVAAMINIVDGNIVNCSVIYELTNAKIVLRVNNSNKIEFEYPIYSFYGYDINNGLQFDVSTGSGIKLYQNSTVDYNLVVGFEETQIINAASSSQVASIYYR